MRVIAVDWSGAKTGASRRIWLAEVRDERLVRLENGRSRRELADHLIGLASADPDVIVGFDFAFSLPAWFLRDRELATAYELWSLAEEEGERWLADCEPPFWGRPDRKKPDLPGHFRETDRSVPSISGIRPKSPFQIGGAGAVGTGSLRGMPILRRLSDAGFRIWPFDEPGASLVIEIYPRLLTGAVTKSNRSERRRFVASRLADQPEELRERAASSSDAFDAAISALAMARHRRDLMALEGASDAHARLEGIIWHPGLHGEEPQASLFDPATWSGPDACPFCQRVAEGTAIARGKHAVAFLDAYPVSEGHALIVPRRHEPDYFGLSARERREMWVLVDDVRRHLEERFGPAGYNIGVNAGEAAGQTLPHVHLYVIPRYEGDVDDPRGGIRHVIPERAAWWKRVERGTAE